MRGAEIAALAIAGGLAYFAALWTGILLLLSVAGGWSKLKAAYANRYAFRGPLLRLGTVYLRGVRYRNIVRLGLGEGGLYLALPPLFNLFHPPLLLPWDQLAAAPATSRSRRGVALSIRSHPGLTITLPPEACEALARRLPFTPPVPPA